MSRRLSRRLGAIACVTATMALFAAGCGSAADNQSSGSTQRQGAAETDVTIGESEKPRRGGSLVYGLEAESDGFDPTVNRFAIAGMMVAMAIYDPLTAYNADGEVEPYLAETIVPNDSYDEWTVTLRDGVTFHNGEPVTANAVKATLEGHKSSLLTSSAVVPVESVAVDPSNPLVAVITMNQPWVAFPAAMTSQVGFVVSEETLADENGSRQPIGSGPFVFKDWKPDNKLVTSANPDYWRADADGEQLPYLASLEFRPIKEANGRVNALLGQDVDVIHTSSPESIARLREEAAKGELQIVEDRGEGEESFVMLNVSSPPLDDVRVREAIALATDRVTYTATIDDNVPEVSNGPFKPSSPWHTDTDYPDFDLTAAQALIAEVEAEKGPVVFSLGTTPSPENNAATQRLQTMWQDAGMDVSVTTTDQAQFIGDALTGNYQANLWRQFGAIDPDTDAVWWLSESTEGTLNLNFARNKDPRIDEALMQGRHEADPAARKQAYADFQRYLSEDLPYIWLNHSLWAVAGTDQVRNLTNGPLPSGNPALPLGGTGTFGGTHRLTHTWIAN